ARFRARDAPRQRRSSALTRCSAIGNSGKATKLRLATQSQCRANDAPGILAANHRASRRDTDAEALLRELERHASKTFLADMSARYGIVTAMPVFGTPMAKMKRIAKAAGRDHRLAA